MISVVILAFNEEERLAQTAQTIIGAAKLAGNVPLDVIIVDDGSVDRTPQVIRELEAQFSSIRSIRHVQNKGPGVGVKEAIALARYPKFIVTPGDNDLPSALLENLFANKDRAEMVMAYYLNMSDRGWFRSSLSELYTWIYRITFGIPVKYINSPTLYPTEALRKIQIHSDRFGYSAEMTVKLLRQGRTFYQVGGARHVDAVPSRAMSWKNLREVIGIYLSLIKEVYITGRRHFNQRPKEIVSALAEDRSLARGTSSSC